MKANKKFAILLASIMLLSQLYSCGNSSAGPENSNDTSDAVSNSEESGSDTTSGASTDSGTVEEKIYSYSSGLDDNGFYIGVKASEIINLPDYKGIEIPKSYVMASDADVQEQLDKVLTNYETVERIYDREVAVGDTVNVDYVGKIDGEEFQGGSTGGRGSDITIGVDASIDDLFDRIAGHKPGETFDLEATFPEDYGVEELNGKDSVFTITVNYIHGDTLPGEFTEDVAADYGFDSTEAMLDDIRKWLVKTQKFNYLVNLTSEATCDNIPESVVNSIMESDLAQYQYYAQIYGVSLENIITMNGYESLDAYISANRSYYEQCAVQCLAFQAIAEIEGLEVTEETIEESGFGSNIDYYGKPYVSQSVLLQLVVPDFVFENAKIVE